MAKLITYAVRNEYGQYLQGVQPNEKYSWTGAAPTMGNLHTPCEYSSVWGHDPKTFEPLTLASNIKVILEEYRWETRLSAAFAVIPWENK